MLRRALKKIHILNLQWFGTKKINQGNYNFSYEAGEKFYRNIDFKFCRKYNTLYTKLLTMVGATVFGYVSYNSYNGLCIAYAKDHTTSSSFKMRIPEKPQLPTYSVKDVSKHNSRKDRVWVTFQNGVYDITDFIDEHPGGDQILMAAGNAVDPFWMLYKVHDSPHVLNILENYRIGNLNSEEENVGNMSDPYANEPERHPALKKVSEQPFNAETPESLLVENFITPNDLFYVRNHLPVPEIDPDTYSLEIELEGNPTIISFSLKDLIEKFPKYSVTSTVMCAGNRRSEMTKVKPVKGLSWGGAAVGNAVWSGASLREVLAAAGLNDENADKYQHIQFEAFDTDATGTSYGASIPIWKAIDKRGDVILAYEMNGSPLPRDHGFPIRAIVPGVVGARNVKWLERIVVSTKESESHWQKNDYKGFSPSTDWDTADFSKSPAIQELPVISAICIPKDGEILKLNNEHMKVKGYAWSGGGQEIVRVDVSCDCGKTWHVANFDHHDTQKSPKHWSWTLWSCDLQIPKGKKEVEIWVKAVDSAYNTQPESFQNIWNLRGVLANAYHKIHVKIQNS